MIAQLFHHLAMTTQEPGAMPGPGLKWYQTFVIFIVIPVAMFLAITGIVLLATLPKKKSPQL
jgi:hypothetical protein